MEELKTYSVLVQLFVRAETEQEAIEVTDEALDASGILFEDGVVGFNVTDDIELETAEEEE